MPPEPEGKCRVCHAPAAYVHFDVLACRGCASFFRRTIGLNKDYKCRHHENCPILHGSRRLCKACRLRKCFETGMQSIGVQRFEHVPIQQTTKETSHIGPTLQRLQHAYSRLLENRKAVYCGGGSFLGLQKPHLMSFRELVDLHKTEVGLTIEFLKDAFEETLRLAPGQMPILYQFFFLHFCFWETGYLTLQSGQTAVLVKQNGNYWDPNAIAETFGDFMNKEASVETVREWFAGLRPVNAPSLVEKMAELELDEVEFLAISALLLWTRGREISSIDVLPGLEGVTEETDNVAAQIQSRIMNEILEYIRESKQDNGARFSQIALLMPLVQMVVEKIQSRFALGEMLDLFAMDKTVAAVLCAKC